MIKKLGIVALLLLAIHFVAIAGGFGYLCATGKLDRERARTIAKILFPDPAPATQPTTEPTTPAIDDPLFQIDALLDKQAGKTAAEQVQVVRNAYESLAAQLDRQRREVIDLRRQVDTAQAQLISERAVLAAREKAFEERIAKRAKQNQEAGFRQELSIFDEMSTGQIKTAFLSMDDATVVRYLQAMEPRRVSRIVKEFTSPEDTIRANRWLGMIGANADDMTGAGTRDAGSAPTGSTTTPPTPPGSPTSLTPPPTPPGG